MMRRLACCMIVMWLAADAIPLRAAILHYSFDDADTSGSTLVDRSGNDHNGTVVGSTTVTPGAPFGQAWHFGAGAYVALNESLLSTTDSHQPYTIAGWVKSDSGSTGGVLLSQYPGVPYENRFGVVTYMNSGKPTWWHNSISDVTASTNVNNQAWHHLAFVKDAAQNLRVYVDGVDETPAGEWKHASAFSNAPTRIGRFSETQAPDFRGSIDELWVFDRPLARYEVDNLKKANSVRPTLLHLSFDTADMVGTTAGSTVRDLSSLGNHGTVIGNSLSAVTSGAPFGQALNFSGGSYVDLGKSLLSTTDPDHPYTISLWAKTITGGAMFSQYSGGEPDRFGLRNNANGGRPSWWHGGGDDLIAESDPDSLSSTTDGQWHHLVFVKDPSRSLRVYIDGVDWTPAGGPFLHSEDFSAASTKIGLLQPATFEYSGAIDEVWVFGYALNPEEIAMLYQFNTLVPEPSSTLLLSVGLIGLIAYARRRR